MKISRQSIREALHRAEEAGLVHNTLNTRENSFFICNCCGCCCAILRGITQLKLPASVAGSNFIAEIARDNCTGCGTCVDRCQVNALELVDDTAALHKERCIGCGLCVSGCDFDAVSLIRRAEDSTPPQTINKLMMKIYEHRRA